MSQRIIVAQLGARMHYAVPVILHQTGMLSQFFTDSFVRQGSAWQMLAEAVRFLPHACKPASLQRFLSRREDGLPLRKVTAYNLFGLRYALKLRSIKDDAARENFFLDYGRRFCDLVLQSGSFSGDTVYAFQSVALPLFAKAVQFGMARILEKTIAPHSVMCQLLSEESVLWAGWTAPYPGPRVWQRRIDQEKEEWQQAEAIVCGSDFVAQGLISLGVPSSKVRVVPYGVKASRFATVRLLWDGRRPLRLLFVGEVSLRKGVQYIYQALKYLAHLPVACRLVGPIAIREPYCARLGELAELTGQVARPAVMQHYAWADLFIFPSICEGSASVIYEALAAGLPVITTPNAGSVVRDGVDGFLIPIRDSQALAGKIEQLARDPELLAWMSQNARDRAQDFSWEKYGERLVEAITKPRQNSF